MCDSDAYVYKNLEDAYSGRDSLFSTFNIVNGNKVIKIANAQGPYFVKIQLNTVASESAYFNSTEYCVFNFVYKNVMNHNYQYSLDHYTPGNGGEISYKWLDWQKLQFSWEKIQKKMPEGVTSHTTYASLYLLKQPNKFMDSVCGIRHAVLRDEAELIQSGIQEQTAVMETRKHPFTKKNSYATFILLASVDKEGGTIPYQRLRVSVAQPWWNLVPWYAWVIVWFIGLGTLLCTVIVLYYRRKFKKTAAKLDYEMKDIRNIARVGYSDENVERVTLSEIRGQPGDPEDMQI